MLKILVGSPAVDVIAYTDKKGQPAQLRKQTAYATVIDAEGNPGMFPEKFGFLLNREQAPFAKGEYQLHPSSFEVTDGKLVLRNVRLTPVVASSAKSA
jgi:Helix-destabilising protein